MVRGSVTATGARVVRIVAVFLIGFVTSCASLSPAEKADKQRALDGMADQAIAELLRKQPELKPRFDEAVGYMVMDAKVTKIPVFGGGGGKGVVVNNVTHQRTYVKATRLDFGAGWGVRAFKVIMLFTDARVLADVEEGGWFYRSGAEAAAGGAAAEGTVAAADQGYQSFALAEGGASATVTIRVIHLKRYL
jgi:lipid-binding SYLF domain-containing protein